MNYISMILQKSQLILCIFSFFINLQLYLVQKQMSSTISGTITIESHSKQVKLLNDYILSLEKKLNDIRESDSIRILKLSDEANKLNDENIKLKNEIGQLKYTIYKHEETIRKNSQLETDLQNLKHHLEAVIGEKNGLTMEYQSLREHLAECQKFLQAAQTEINNRTEIFNKDSSHLTDIIDKQKKQIEEKTTKIKDLEGFYQNQKQRFLSQIVNLEKSHSEIIKSKNQTLGKLVQELSATKKNLEEEGKQKALQMTKGDDLSNQLNQKIEQITDLTKVKNQYKARLEAKENEANSYISKLNSRNQQYDKMIKTNSEEKSNLIRIIRRLEDEKKMLESVNSAAKGDISSQLQQNQQLINRNQALSKELSVTNSQLDSANKENQKLNQEKNMLNTKVNSLENNLAEVTISRDNAHSRIKELESIISAAKGDISFQLQQNQQLVNRNQILCKDLSEAISQLDAANKENQNLNQQKNMLNTKVSSLESNLAEVKDITNSKIKDLENTIIQIQNQAKTMKNNLEDQISVRNLTIKKLNQIIEDHESRIRILTKQKAEAHEQIAKTTEGKSSSEKYYANKVKDLEDELSKTQQQLRLTKEQLATVENSFEGFKKKKEEEVEGLNVKVKNLISDQGLLKSQSDNNSKDFLSFKQSKESEIDGLLLKIKELQKEKATLEEILSKTKQQYLLYKKRKEEETDDLNTRVRDLQKENLSIKDTLDTTTREYYTYQKKKETDVETLNDRLKEAMKKIEKKDLKIENLQEQIKQVQKMSEDAKKMLNSNQKQELDRLKTVYINENTNLKKELGEERLKREELTTQKQQLSQKVGELELQVKTQKDDIKNKDKLSIQTQRKMQIERDKLLNQIKNLNISTVMASQTTSTKQLQVESLKKTNSNLESIISQQKKNSENIVKLMQEKEKQIESLEISNAMLRKQLISSIDNEENSRKEVVNLRKSGCSIPNPFQQTRQRSAVFRSKSKVQFIDGRFTQSKVESQDGPKGGSKKKISSKSSIIDEIQKWTKDPQEIPTTPQAEERDQITQI